jgi:hypothetical protein
VAGAAVQGTAHQKQDLPCQDAVGYLVTENGALLAVLADGAGTAGRAAAGARVAVEEALTSLAVALGKESPTEEEGWRAVIQAAFQEARQALERLAEADELPLRAFATTLACAVATDSWLIAGQIGDGSVVAGTETGDLFAATSPQRGEYVNETFFLTQPDALEHLEIHALAERVIALALFSDGLLRLALRLPANEPHPPFFAPLLSFLAQADGEAGASERLAAFLASERVCARTDDDKSLVLAVRPGFLFHARPLSSAGPADAPEF